MLPVLSYATAYMVYVPVPGASCHFVSYLLLPVGEETRAIRFVPSLPSFVYKISTSVIPLASVAVTLISRGKDVVCIVALLAGVCRVILGADESGLIINVR